MKARQYKLAEAFSDLQTAGLLSGCHLFTDGQWQAWAEFDLLPQDLFFERATLDSRNVGDGALFVALAGENHDGRDFISDALRQGAQASLTRSWSKHDADPILSGNPDHNTCVLLSDQPQQALTCLAAAHRHRCQATVFGVTGTNGKTTTKDLLATLLATQGATTATDKNFNNDLGVPLTLLALSRDDRFAVAEMGASRQGDIARLSSLVQPDVGLITNAAGAHLEGFDSLNNIIKTKGELLQALPRNGRAVLNADSTGFDVWLEMSPCPTLTWGRECGDFRWHWHPGHRGGGILDFDGQRYESPLSGEHNAANLAAALTALRSIDLTILDTSQLKHHFAASPHRGQISEIDGVVFIDDSYNANPDSMLASVRMLAAMPTQGRRIAVIGGMAELGPQSADMHRETGGLLAELDFDRLLGVGELTQSLVEGCLAAGGKAEFHIGHASAVSELMNYCRQGDTVLLKGSRSTAMEKILELYIARHEHDLDKL